MTMTDPIADMLTRVRNANSAGKATVSMPSSKKLVEIARIMQEEGYVAGYEVVEGEPRATLEITLKYGEKKAKTIRGIRRISKPGLRRQGRAAPRSGRPRHCNRLHVQRRDDRPRRPQEGHRRRGYRVHLVGKEGIGLCLVSASSPLPFLPAST